MSTLVDAPRKPSTRRFYGELFEAAVAYIRDNPDGVYAHEAIIELCTSQRTLHRALELHGHCWRTLVHQIRSEG